MNAHSKALADLESATQFTTNRSMAVSDNWLGGWDACLRYVRTVLADQFEASRQRGMEQEHALWVLASETQKLGLYDRALSADAEPVVEVLDFKGNGEPVVKWTGTRFLDHGTKLYTTPSSPGAAEAGEAVAGDWEGAEEWMPLAWELCANECGEEACTELVWEGGPIPEPWGDRWLKYEGQAREMIAMVRKHVPSLAATHPKAEAEARPVGEVALWQWRRKGNPWTLEFTFNTPVIATTEDSEVRVLYAARQALSAAPREVAGEQKP